MIADILICPGAITLTYQPVFLYYEHLKYAHSIYPQLCHESEDKTNDIPPPLPLTWQALFLFFYFLLFLTKDCIRTEKAFVESF